MFTLQVSPQALSTVQVYYQRTSDEKGVQVRERNLRSNMHSAKRVRLAFRNRDHVLPLKFPRLIQ